MSLSLYWSTIFFLILLSISSRAADQEVLSRHEVELREYQSKQLDFQMKMGIVSDGEAEFKKLTEQKEIAKDPRTKALLMEQMESSHSRLLEARKKMLELKKELQYRYPDKGTRFDRKFLGDGSPGPTDTLLEKGTENAEGTSPSVDPISYAMELARRRYPFSDSPQIPTRVQQQIEPQRLPASSEPQPSSVSPKKWRLEK